MAKKKLLFVFLTAFLLRVAWISTLDNTVDHWGEEGVKEAAWNLIAGRGYEIPRDVWHWQEGTEPYRSWREPMLSFLLVPVFLTAGENFLVVKIILALFAGFTALATWALARRIFDSDRVAFIAALIVAALPEAVYWSGHITPETLGIFMLILPVLFLMKSLDDGRARNLAAAGFLLGLSALTRAQTVIVAPFLLGAFILMSWNRLRATARAAAILLVALAAFSPWLIRNYRLHGRMLVLPTVTGEVLYIANNPGALERIHEPAGFYHGEDPSWFAGLTELQVFNLYRGMAFRFILTRPLDYLRLSANRFVRFWRFYPHLGAAVHDHFYGYAHLAVGFLTSGLLIVLSAAGVVMSFKSWRRTLLLLVLVLAFSTLTIMGRVVIRYRLPLIPYLAIFAAYSAEKIFFRRKNDQRRLLPDALP